MNKVFRKIEKITSAAIILSYFLMTVIVAFHFHNVDVNLHPISEIGDTQSNEEASALNFKECVFIHQASNTVQFFEKDANHINRLTFVAFAASLNINSISLVQIHAAHLRAPPNFS